MINLFLETYHYNYWELISKRASPRYLSVRCNLIYNLKAFALKTPLICIITEPLQWVLKMQLRCKYNKAAPFVVRSFLQVFTCDLHHFLNEVWAVSCYCIQKMYFAYVCGNSRLKLGLGHTD